MADTGPDPYFSNVGKIVDFFKAISGSGFLFCECDNNALVRRINENIIQRAGTRGLKIIEAYIPAESEDKYLRTIREAADKKPNGVIVNNLDEAILRSGNDFIRAANFSREILIDLELPLLFWLSEKNMARFANKAPDFFIRRDRGIVHFADVEGRTALDRFDAGFSPEYKSSEDYQNLKIRIELLEKQLKEAEEKGFPEKRIALEIAPALIDLYNSASLVYEAFAVFKKYRKFLKQSTNVRHVDIIAELYLSVGRWDEAISKYLQNERKYSEAKEQKRLARTYIRIGRIFWLKAEWNKALDYYDKSHRIIIKEGNNDLIGTLYGGIGLVYWKMGEWDMALEFQIKSEKIYLESNNRLLLGETYHRIALVYFSKQEWEKALDYELRSEELSLETGDYCGLGWIYNLFGLIYFHKGNRNKAIEYYLKSEKIRIEVGDPRGIAYTWINIGEFYCDVDREKAITYLTPAGYLLKKLGLKYEFIGKESGTEWMLKDIINEIGEEQFMTEGERIYKEKIGKALTE